jgi:hypothetical protein
LDVAERIRTNPPDPNPTADCEYCDARRLCPLQPEGRQVTVAVTARVAQPRSGKGDGAGARTRERKQKVPRS